MLIDFECHPQGVLGRNSSGEGESRVQLSRGDFYILMQAKALMGGRRVFSIYPPPPVAPLPFLIFWIRRCMGCVCVGGGGTHW